MSFRSFFASIAVAAILASGSPAPAQSPPDAVDSSGLAADDEAIRVTLLGTGNPPPSLERFGPSILVQAGDRTLVFDVGRGAAQRLFQLGVPFERIDAVFLTHLHSDHVVGLPDLWLTGWLMSRRSEPLAVFGPAGTAAMAGHLEEAFSFDVGIRIADDKIPASGGRLEGREIGEGTVYEEDGVRVIAFDVDHGPVRPAVGYRIEYAGRVVVLSGDTRFSPNLIEFSAGADLLIHEVVVAPADLDPVHPDYPVVDHHTLPEQVGRVFDTVKPRLAVYSHIVQDGRQEEELLGRTRATYSGALEIGYDLMSFEVGNELIVRRWHSDEAAQPRADVGAAPPSH